TLVDRARVRGVRAIVDAAGEPLRRALEARPWLVKVNRQEAVDALGETDAADPASLARQIASRTKGAAIVTLGSEGALVAISAAEMLRVGRAGQPGPYPVGSGDVFLGGLARAILARRPLQEALRR